MIMVFWQSAESQNQFLIPSPGFSTKRYGNIRGSGSFCVVFKSHSVVQQCCRLPKGISVSLWSYKFIHTRRIHAHAASLVSQHWRQHEAKLVVLQHIGISISHHLTPSDTQAYWCYITKRSPQVFAVDSPESGETMWTAASVQSTFI